jgi:hypothetical protein
MEEQLTVETEDGKHVRDLKNGDRKSSLPWTFKIDNRRRAKSSWYGNWKRETKIVTLCVIDSLLGNQ